MLSINNILSVWLIISFTTEYKNGKLHSYSSWKVKKQTIKLIHFSLKILFVIYQTFSVKCASYSDRYVNCVYCNREWLINNNLFVETEQFTSEKREANNSDIIRTREVRYRGIISISFSIHILTWYVYWFCGL